jgi:hypothetical protein
MPGTRVGSLDIQFGPVWEQAKANQLVQSVQQVISAVNTLTNQVANLAAGGSGSGPVTVPPHGLVSKSHTVSGLSAGAVLMATGSDSFAFGVLRIDQLAQTDETTLADPLEGDVLTFHDGFWSAEPGGMLGLSDPGSNALVMWNEAAKDFAWAIPVAGAGISLIPGQIAVNDFELTHGHLLGLLADDHPQYALIGAVNTWAFLQTFQAGITVDVGLNLNGNFEQVGQEPEWFFQNTDDSADEGSWRMHAEPGQLIFSSVNDDGSDGENWLSASRIGGIVDAVNISSNSLTWNGDQVLTVASLASGTNVYFSTNAAGQLLVNAANSSGGSGGGVANPTALVGLTAVNGTATTAIRSDGAPALSQAIAPTWTGVHVFAATVGTPVSIDFTSASQDALLMADSNTGGRTLRMGPGSGGTAAALIGFFDNAAGALRMGISATGQVLINAPSSGIALTTSTFALTAAAPTVAAAQVGFGGTTSTTASTTIGGIAIPALVAGFLVINVAGAQCKVAFYAN